MTYLFINTTPKSKIEINDNYDISRSIIKKENINNKNNINSNTNKNNINSNTNKKPGDQRSVDDLMAKLTPSQKKYFDVGLKSGMLPIGFHGKIIDQNGDTVINAKVTYCTGGALLASGKGCGATFTNENGEFSIKSIGGSLTLFAVIHPEIDFQYPNPTFNGKHSAKTLQMSFYGYQKTHNGNDPLWTDTSKEKPYIFTAWRLSEFEKIIVDNRDLIFKPDGRVYTIDLTQKRDIHKFIKDGKFNTGHLYISCKRVPRSKNNDNGDWEITITPVLGGIQSTQSQYLNLAPILGYKNSLSIYSNKSDKNYQDHLFNERYFFKSNNGKEYGSLYINFNPFIDNDYCDIEIRQYKLNTNGSRNLIFQRK